MKTTFTGFTGKYHIAIPELQRDYVQGADHNSRKRNPFVAQLLDTLVAGNTPMQLDFIYGSSEHSDFMPIDGQQRLTTLTLMAWLIDQRTGGQHRHQVPVLTYHARPSTEQFTHWLREYIIPPYDPETPLSKHLRTVPGWFASKWALDPSICAMLQLLDHVDALLASPTYAPHLPTIAQNLFDNCPIQFEALDLEALDLNDDLYIKMNARGKMLTPFENWKAAFEGMIATRHTNLIRKGAQIPGTTGEPLMSQYVEYTIEHDWTDMLWPNALKQWQQSAPDDKARAYPRIDEWFVRILDLVGRFIYYPSLTDAEELAKSQRIEMRELYQSQAETLRVALFQNADNLNLLIDTLDLVAKIQAQGSAKMFDSLFTNTFIPRDPRVNIYKGPTDLLTLCLEGNLDINGEVMLWSVLTYLRHHPQCIQAPTDHQLNYLRIMMGWLRHRRQRLLKNLQVNPNTRLDNLGEITAQAERLACAPDLKAALNQPIPQTLEHEKEKISLLGTPAYQAVVTLSNHPDLYNCLSMWLPSLKAAHDPSQYIDHFCQFMSLDSTTRIQTLAKYGYNGVSPMMNYWFYGATGKWDFIFTAPKGAKGFDNACQAITAYMQSQPTLPLSPDTFTYYISRYPHFLNAIIDPICHTTPRRYFHRPATFTAWAVKTYSTNPILGYNVCPYSATVMQLYNGTARLRTWSTNSEHGVIYIDKDGDNPSAFFLECIDLGWKITIENPSAPRSQKLQTLIAANTLPISPEMILHDLPGKDRIESAIDFLNLL